ncbi:MAG: PspC domain-containing protein [Bacteroidaceae bacterium]|nr:PspC domain-containing protein [Bacteroidaceae bacterium]
MQKRYYLSQTDKKLAGVCGGLAEYFDVDPLLVRIGMLVLTFCGGGGLLLYIVLALLAPKGPNGTPTRMNNLNSNNYSSSNNGSQSTYGGSHYDKG